MKFQMKDMMNIFSSAYYDILWNTTPKKLNEEAELFYASANAALCAIGNILKQFVLKLDLNKAPDDYLLSCIKSFVCPYHKQCEPCSNCCKGFLSSVYYLFYPQYRYQIEDFKDTIHFIQTQRIRQKLQNSFGRKQQPKDYYNLLHKRFSKRETNQNYFLNLKGMSSSSPILYNSALHTDYAGGGFYLKWNGFGVAVDPGYNFAKNLSYYGLTIHDIHAVIITHDHIDHSSDARLLLDMEYQLHKTGERFIQWYVDTRTARTLKTWMNDNDENLTIIDPQDYSLEKSENYEISPSIYLSPFLTAHVIDEKTKGTASYQSGTFGFVMKLQDSGLHTADAPYLFGYTSDTTYFPALSTNFNQIDFLLANISSVYEQELIQPKQNPRHLGLTGIIRLLQEMDTPPRLLAISEFWSGISDIRYDITTYIGEYLRVFAEKNDWTIVPLESGISIEIPSNYIKCTFCGTYVKRIHMIRPRADFEEIQFACRDCIY